MNAVLVGEPRGTLRPAASDVYAARARIADRVRRTPLERSAWLSELAGTDVFLKLECWQPTRSFKVRGATNAVALLPAAARAAGVVTASAGNHGQAVARAAAEAGVRAVVFVPRDAPTSKKDRIRSFGATLDESAATYDDAEVLARAHAAASGATLVHAFSDPDVVAGQGTIALELLEDLPELAAVVLPVGGGGLIAGIGTVLAAAAPGVRVVGVQSTETVAMHEALRAGRLVDTPVTPTLADGLAGCTDEASFRRVRRLVSELHLVEEAELAGAMRELFRRDGVVVEGAAAVTVAAVRTLDLALRGPTVLIITGGNVDAARFSRILAG